MITEIDHILIGSRDLTTAAEWCAQSFGKAPRYGGRHTGQGTHNALLGFGHNCYLETIAPDPASPDRSDVRRTLETFDKPGLFWWCCRSADLTFIHDVIMDIDGASCTLADGERTSLAGDRISWRLLMPDIPKFGRIFPFFIDWEQTEHPSEGLDHCGTIQQCTLHSPHADELDKILQKTGMASSITTHESNGSGLVINYRDNTGSRGTLSMSG